MASDDWTAEMLDTKLVPPAPFTGRVELADAGGVLAFHRAETWEQAMQLAAQSYKEIVGSESQAMAGYGKPEDYRVVIGYSTGDYNGIQ